MKQKELAPHRKLKIITIVWAAVGTLIGVSFFLKGTGVLLLMSGHPHVLPSS